MRKLIFALLLCNCMSAISQTTFDAIEAEIRSWYSENQSTFALNSKTPRIKKFPMQHYSIEGVFSKGILCEGTIAKFYDISSLTPKLLLEGKVNYYATSLIIDGIKYYSTPAGTNKIFGSFYVYNQDDYSMIYKAKKAGDLKIKCQNAAYLEGFYLQCPVIVRLVGNNSSVYIDGKTGGRGYSFLSAVIPNITLNDDDSFDIYQMLLQAKDNVMMCWKDGTTFKGRVKPTPREDGAIIFQILEGQKTGMTVGPKRITVSRDNGKIVYSQDNSEDNKLLSNETLLVKDDGKLSDVDFWNLEKIYNLCYLAKWTYRNGNYFEGTIKTVVTPNEGKNTSTFTSTATKGVFKYSNGDRFEGDISSKTVGPFFVDGTTIFKDGSKVKGNWLEKFRLNKNQWEKVNKCLNPSEAKALAQKLMHSNSYPKYEYSGLIEYFDPSDEKRNSTWTSYIIYDKAKNRYTCKYRDSQKVVLEFAVDNKGQRKWEIVFENGKPTYINEFTWYSNAVVESIKSFLYDTRKIYLSCNFFSDGKLRSAYQYSRGNTGENILRKSKESHPTYSGYTCKLYDLNGNYERSIDWKIGVGEGLFGGTYVQEMAPSHLISSNLKPIE